MVRPVVQSTYGGTQTVHLSIIWITFSTKYNMNTPYSKANVLKG